MLHRGRGAVKRPAPVLPGHALGMDPARLLPTLADLPGDGWRALPLGADAWPAGPTDGELTRLLAGRLPEEDVVAVADSPLFVRDPAGLAYATAALLSGPRAGAAAFRLVASAEFARTFAESIAAEVVTAPGTAHFLGSTTRPLRVAPAVPPGTEVAVHRTTFGAATTERVVPVHVDLVALAAGPRLLLLWLADAPDPVPEADLARVVARVAARVADRVAGSGREPD